MPLFDHQPVPADHDRARRVRIDRLERAEHRDFDAELGQFVRADGNFLATVRVLQFATDADAVAAVDFYLPRETTNPEDRPAGWAGGSLVQEDSVIYGVSKGPWAVIAVANSDQTVRARLLVEHAIENLAL